MEEIIKKIKTNWLLVVIFLFAFTIRVYWVSKIPYGFDGDEAAVGYYAYSLIQNLSDEFGNKLPLYFPSIGDYKYPGYSYMSVIPVFIFGLNVFSARFLSVLCGSMLVILMYYLAIEIFGNKKIAIITSILTAISPYSIMFSKGAYESNVAMFFMTLGLFGLIYSAARLNRKYAYYSVIPLVVSTYAYPAPRLFLLIFLPLLHFSMRRGRILIMRN